MQCWEAGPLFVWGCGRKVSGCSLSSICVCGGVLAVSGESFSGVCGKVLWRLCSDSLFCFLFCLLWGSGCIGGGGGGILGRLWFKALWLDSHSACLL